MLFCSGQYLCLFVTQWHTISAYHMFLSTWHCKKDYCFLACLVCLLRAKASAAAQECFFLIFWLKQSSGYARVWYKYTPSSRQAVEESIIWRTSKFTVLILCWSLPSSLWSFMKTEYLRKNSCFEAKCNKKKPEQSAYVFIPYLSCYNRLCNREIILPTITLTICPDLQ